MEVGRDLKGRETRVRRWMRDRFLQNNFIFIYLSIVVILFFLLSVNCLLLIFFCLTCVDFFFAILCFFVFFVCFFFLLYFALFFVGFGGLGLPCHLLCCLLLFVYSFFIFIFILFFFIFIFIFFYLHGFSGFIFRKFNCSWHFFTSSDRVPPGLGAREPRFADWYRGVVSYTSDDLGGRVAWLTWN